MNQHQQIMTEIARQYEHMRDAVLIGPSSLAHRVFEQFATGDEEPHISYACVEQMKQMARRFLARNCDPESDENEIYGDQAAFEFSGKLQARNLHTRSAAF